MFFFFCCYRPCSFTFCFFFIHCSFFFLLFVHAHKQKTKKIKNLSFKIFCLLAQILFDFALQKTTKKIIICGNSKKKNSFFVFHFFVFCASKVFRAPLFLPFLIDPFLLDCPIFFLFFYFFFLICFFVLFFFLPWLNFDMVRCRHYRWFLIFFFFAVVNSEVWNH